MQGQRATFTSMSGLFDLDHGSSSSNASVDQQFLWGDIQDPEQTQELESLPSGSTTVNPFSHEHQNLQEDRGYGQSSLMFSLDNVNLDPQLGQGSGSGSGSSSRSFPVNLNVSPGFVGHGSESSPLMEMPDLFSPSMSEFQGFQATSSSNPFGEESSRGGSSVEGRRLPCKRKFFHVEGLGQPSMAGSSSAFQNGESSSGPVASAPELAEPRLALGVSGSRERLRRDFRLLINSLGQNGTESPAPYSASAPNAPSSGIFTAGNTNTVGNEANVPPQPTPIHIPPALPLNGLSVRWNRGRNSAGSSNSVTNNEGNMLEHPMFVPGNESTSFVHNPVARSVGSRSICITGNVSAASPSEIHQSSSQSTRPMQYPRRLSEYVRRSLSSVGSDTIGHNINFAAPSAAPQETAIPSRSSSRGRHALPLRSAYTERQGDQAVGLPYSVRSLAAASEGRRRLVSEIRNVLDMMRRGEGLRFEDFMILDQSVFLGVADMHDRHRDMRLDVDNMSYEELLALEERIGIVSTGLSEETILTRMKQRKCVIIADTHNEAEEPCSICREEYNDGEDLGTLECGHDFHRDCIKQWLMQKNICPICKTTGLNT